MTIMSLVLLLWYRYLCSNRHIFLLYWPTNAFCKAVVVSAYGEYLNFGALKKRKKDLLKELSRRHIVERQESFLPLFLTVGGLSLTVFKFIHLVI